MAEHKNEMYGEWNSVLIDKNWRFVDCYWGSCAEKSDPNGNETVYSVDEAFFISDPEELIYSHFPVESKWQLLDKALTMKQFQRGACLMERFFDLNMKVLTHKFCEITTDSGEMEIIFGIPEERAMDLDFMALIYQQDGSKWNYLINKCFQHDFVYRRNDNSIAVRIRFPRRGVYRVELIGKDTTIEDANYEFDWLAIYKVKVNGVPEGLKSFPIPGNSGWGPAGVLRDVGLRADEDR